MDDTMSRRRTRKWWQEQDDDDSHYYKDEDYSGEITSSPRKHTPSPQLRALQERESSIKRRLQHSLEVSRQSFRCYPGTKGNVWVCVEAH